MLRNRQVATEALFGTAATPELKQRSLRGGLIALVAQGLTFTIQTGSTVVLARLLSPEDFGLLGMVVAMTGFLTLFRDAGLGIASVQRDVLTQEQASALFWINVAVGVILALIAVVSAPLLVMFYREPRLLAITMASAVAFMFNGLAVQHRALLNRAMRFAAMAKIDILALAGSASIAVGMAVAGCGYWALVGMALGIPAITAAAVWIAMPWVPGRPARTTGLRSMLHVGGGVTLNGLVVYLAYNTEKILLGRFWGAESLGLYGRAYQLANLPVQQLNSSMSTVAYPALSRAQGNPERVGRSFLEGYSIVVSMTIPVTIGCAVYAEEIVRLVLGTKWAGAAMVLRLLAPAMLGFSLVNPFGWFLQATGRLKRSLNTAFVIAPVVILGIVAGLSHGPQGVALGYSTAMVLLIVPCVVWAIHGTGMTMSDYWDALKRPLVSGVMAGVAGLLLKLTGEAALAPIPLLIAGLALMAGVYAFALLVVMGQKDRYVDLLRQVLQRKRPALANG